MVFGIVHAAVAAVYDALFIAVSALIVNIAFPVGGIGRKYSFIVTESVPADGFLTMSSVFGKTRWTLIFLKSTMREK